MAETDFMMVVVIFAGIFIFRLHRRCEMTNLEFFNKIGETKLSAEDTALVMILSEFEHSLVRDFALGLYMESNDNCRRYI